ncbi:MAG: SAM-dependent methyltransferase [Chloroflexota bacterium]
MDTIAKRDPGSFRDPSGFVFRRDGVLYRQVNQVFADDWGAAVDAGILRRWQAGGRLVGHEVVDVALAADPERALTVLRPDPVAFISHPYEWTFGQLKDAALLTLDLQEDAERSGFTLRDASAYNVQFDRGRPILIDSLSLERRAGDEPWSAYRQFCQHFVAPLALMARRDIRCGLMLRDHVDGIPLDLAATLLPGRTRLSTGLGSHVHLHARAQQRYADAAREAPRRAAMGVTRRAALLDSLRRTIQGLHWSPGGTEWADYDLQTSYSDEGTRAKESIVEAMLRDAGGAVVWDLGANVGRFSAIAAGLGRRVVAWDVDPAASERHYRRLVAAGETSVLPLVQNLVNPSPALGWAGTERAAFVDRSDADVVIALALVHHLAISNNVPLEWIAALFAKLAPAAIVEFVPKDDLMVRRLLSSRRDVFPDYTQDGFERSFGRHFQIAARSQIPDSQRVIYQLGRA